MQPCINNSTNWYCLFTTIDSKLSIHKATITLYHTRFRERHADFKICVCPQPVCVWERRKVSTQEATKGKWRLNLHQPVVSEELGEFNKCLLLHMCTIWWMSFNYAWFNRTVLVKCYKIFCKSIEIKKRA